MEGSGEREGDGADSILRDGLGRKQDQKRREGHQQPAEISAPGVL